MLLKICSNMILACICFMNLLILPIEAENNTVLVKQGNTAVAEVDAPSKWLLIQMEQPRRFLIKGTYNPWIHPGYNFTFFGNKGVFQIGNFSSNKSGLYFLMFTIPVNDTHADFKSIYIEVLEAADTTKQATSIGIWVGIALIFIAVVTVVVCLYLRKFFSGNYPVYRLDKHVYKHVVKSCNDKCSINRAQIC